MFSPSLSDSSKRTQQYKVNIPEWKRGWVYVENRRWLRFGECWLYTESSGWPWVKSAGFTLKKRSWLRFGECWLYTESSGWSWVKSVGFTLKKRSWLRLESADFTLKIEAKLDCRVLFLHWKYRLTLNGECWLCTENRSWLRLESAVFTLKIEVVSERRVLASHWK